MEDSAETRQEIAWFLERVTEADRVCICRFRRHTLRSRAKDFVDGFSDDDGPRRNNAPKGLKVRVYQAQEVLHDWEVHPAKDDLEAALLPAVATAAQRGGASLEAFVEDEAFFRLDASWWRRRLVGYRDAPQTKAASLPAETYVWTDSGMTYTKRWGPTWWAIPILAVILLGSLPVVALAMLFPKTRRVLVDITRSVCFGGEARWSWTRDGGTWHVEETTNGSSQRISFAPASVVLFFPAPYRWCKPAGECRSVWVVHKQGDAMEVPLATGMHARFVAGLFAEHAPQ